MNNVEYKPRNDYVLLSVVGERNLVVEVGPLVPDLRKGDWVVLPEREEGDHCCWHELDEDGTLLLVRDHFIMATERSLSGGRSAYEDFHS